VLGRLWREWSIPFPRWVAATAVIAVVVTPVALIKKFRFDRDPPLPYIEAMAAAVNRELPDNAKLLIVVLKDDGLQATVMRMRTWRTTRTYHIFDNDTFDPAVEILPDRPNYAWIYCTTGRLNGRFELDLPTTGASLAHYQPGEGWRTVHTWPYPLPPDADTGHDKFHHYGCPF